MVVDKAVQETEYNFCNKCECKWNRRNTTTIKVSMIELIGWCQKIPPQCPKYTSPQKQMLYHLEPNNSALLESDQYVSVASKNVGQLNDV